MQVCWLLTVGGLRPPPASRQGMQEFWIRQSGSTDPNRIQSDLLLAGDDPEAMTCLWTPQTPSYLVWEQRSPVPNYKFNMDILPRLGLTHIQHYNEKVEVLASPGPQLNILERKA